MSGRPATNRNDEGTALRVRWLRSNRPLPRRLLRPLQSFLEQEAASGVVLLAPAVAALVWANSPWRTSYDALWSNQLSIRLGPLSVEDDLRRWVNDGLMALFFLVVGLEIKRELPLPPLSMMDRPPVKESAVARSSRSITRIATGQVTWRPRREASREEATFGR